MNFADVLHDYFRLTTDIPFEIYDKEIKNDIHNAHFIYAREIVSMYHNKQDAVSAEKRYKEISLKTIPENIETIKINENPISLISLLCRVGFAGSNSDARRLIDGGGVKIDNIQIKDKNHIVRDLDSIVLSKGKGQYLKIEFN